jgi:2-polyprenyl-6-methoxyphenol hydroxylase-like FAD-dependent oxidoreductase
VIGAGLAGLTAARVLACRFGEVVVLDRDRLPATATPRRGVPQGAHPHTLLVAGQRALEELFSGLRNELAAAGAAVFESTSLRFHRYGALWPPVWTGYQMITMTRPLLEVALRRRIAALPNIVIRDEAAVGGLTATNATVTGVVLHDGETLYADLVVDCSGRGNRSDRWLAAIRFPPPEVSEVRIGVGYASRLLSRKPGDLPDGVGVLVQPTPPHERRIGIVLPVEDDRWLVGVGGWHGDSPSTNTEDTFYEHAWSLPYRGIADLLDVAEPLTDVTVHRFPSSRRRHFERQLRLPGGYLAMGDAIASFNPVYGQGMTVAALQALALGRLLDRHPDQSAQVIRAFYRQAARIISTPWRFGVGGDFAYPQTSGPRPPAVNLINRYSARVQRAAQVSVDVRRTLVGVHNLVLPPTALLRPAMVGKVLAAARRRQPPT